MYYIMDFIHKSRDLKILNMLSKAAEAYEDHGVRQKHAAALVLRNDIIAIGFNRKKTHPFQARFQTHEKQVYLHAETDVINRALRYIQFEDFRKAKLYVARVKYLDNLSTQTIWAESKPCEGCQRAINSYGIQKVIYTQEGDYKYM